MRGGRIAMLAALAFPALTFGQDKVSPEPPYRVEHRMESGTGQIKTGAPGGVLLTLENLSVNGRARFTFKDGDSPTRFTVRLAKFGPAREVLVGNGRVTLTGGQSIVGSSALRFDESGKPALAEGVTAYTLTLEQHKDGNLDVHVRCAPGRSLGKDLTLGWAKQQIGPVLRGGGAVPAGRVIINRN